MRMEERRLMDLCDGLQHIGIPSSDVAASCRFYEGLGFERAFQTVIRGNQDVVFCKSGNLVLEIYGDEESRAAAAAGAESISAVSGAAASGSAASDLAANLKRAPGPVDHIAVDCLDVEAAFALAREKGYEIVSDGIEELPFWERGVRFFMIAGPDGERIEFDQKL